MPSDHTSPDGSAGRTDCDAADGSDRDRIETWPEKGIGGGQLGPDRNGRTW